MNFQVVEVEVSMADSMLNQEITEHSIEQRLKEEDVNEEVIIQQAESPVHQTERIVASSKRMVRKRRRNAPKYNRAKLQMDEALAMEEVRCR